MRMGIAGLVLAGGLALAGCGASTSSGSGAQAARSQESQAHQVLQSATANPSVQAAIRKARTDVVNPCIDASTGPVSFKNCVYAKIPAAQRVTVRHCVEKALISDHISTQAGKQQWLDTDVPACVGAVLK